MTTRLERGASDAMPAVFRDAVPRCAAEMNPRAAVRRMADRLFLRRGDEALTGAALPAA